MGGFVLYAVVGGMLLIAAAVYNLAMTGVGLLAGWVYHIVRGPGRRQGVVVSFLIGAVLGIVSNALFDLGNPLLGPWATVVGFYVARWLPADAARNLARR